jgi:hypothetical protein
VGRVELDLGMRELQRLVEVAPVKRLVEPLDDLDFSRDIAYS